MKVKSQSEGGEKKEIKDPTFKMFTLHKVYNINCDSISYLEGDEILEKGNIRKKGKRRKYQKKEKGNIRKKEKGGNIRKTKKEILEKGKRRKYQKRKKKEI